MTESVLTVEDLTVRFPTDYGVVQAVRGVSYELAPGEVLGIVGESGSGKSVTSLAIMGLLPKMALITGSVRFRGQEILGLSEKQMQGVRGNKVATMSNTTNEAAAAWPPFAGERTLTRAQDPQLGPRVEQLLDEIGDRVDDVLAVVEDDDGRVDAAPARRARRLHR